MMTNDELKKKIESIIRNAKRDFAYCVPEEWAVKVLADALIAAGIGDVKEAERKAFVYSKEIAHLDKELKEAQHRAEVAERALLNLCVDIQPYSLFDQTPLVTEASVKMQEYLQQAEKEFAEERKSD